MGRIMIITDHKWKDLRYRHEVPARILANEFDYLEEDTYDGFFRYRRFWYHLSQFMRIGYPGQVPADSKWHATMSDSMSTGVLIEISPDGEQYRAGFEDGKEES